MRLDPYSCMLLVSIVLANVSCQRAGMQYQTPTAANLTSQHYNNERRNQDRKTEWKTVFSSSSGFSSVSFADETHGIATGPSEYYWVTSDGGSTWREHRVREFKLGQSAEDNLVRSVMSRSGVAYAIGHLEDAGSEIFRAKSPFENWKIDTYFDHSLNDISVVDDQAWIVGNNKFGGFILQAKGDQRWKRIWKSKEVTLSGVSFLNSITGWCVGDGIIHTQDGGLTWKTQKAPTKEGLKSIAFADSQNGYAVGWNGTIIHTSDGGETWNEQVSGTNDNLTQVVVANPNEAWVIGDNLTLLYTSDAGRQWKKLYVPLSSSSYNRINGIALRGKQIWLVSEGSIMYME